MKNLSYIDNSFVWGKHGDLNIIKHSISNICKLLLVVIEGDGWMFIEWMANRISDWLNEWMNYQLVWSQIFFLVQKQASGKMIHLVASESCNSYLISIVEIKTNQPTNKPN